MTQARTTASARLPLVVGLFVAALAGVLVGLALTTAQPVAGVAEPGAAVRYGLPVVRVLLDLAAVATVGLTLLPILVGLDRPKHLEPVLAARRRAAAVGGAGAGRSPRCWRWCCRPPRCTPGAAVSPGAVVAYVREVGAGKALVFVAAVALLAFVLGIASVRSGEAVPAELRAAVALFGLLPLPVTGHATNLEWRDFTMISLELHVLGAVAWTGGLGAVVVAAGREPRRCSPPRCRGSPGSPPSASRWWRRPGCSTRFMELTASRRDLLDALFGTGYGVLVLLKLTCLVGCSPRSAATSASGCCRRSCATSGPRSSGWAALELSVMGAGVRLRGRAQPCAGRVVRLARRSGCTFGRAETANGRSGPLVVRTGSRDRPHGRPGCTGTGQR